MSNADTTDAKLINFIRKSKETHETIYDYSQVIYVNSNTVVKIGCPTHGFFYQKAGIHIRGSDCPLCSRAKQVKKRCTLESFIQKAHKVHGNKYNYDKTKYTLVKNKIIITCPIHGDFEQKANSHLTGVGCPSCGRMITIKAKTDSQENVLTVFTQVHGDRYDYSKMKYINNHSKIEIICKVHGSFFQTPKSHKRGANCPNCGVKVSKPEQDIVTYIRSFYDGVILQSYRPSWLDGKELDIYIPEFKFAIEYNGTSFHHSSRSKFVNNYYKEKNKSNNYHYNKWYNCFNNGVTLLSIYDFYWKIPNKKQIYLHKISHYLQKDYILFEHQCELEEVSNQVANRFYDQYHLEGNLVKYPDVKSFALKINNEIVLLCSIDKLKLHRVCALANTTVIGGIPLMFKFLQEHFGNFSYQISLASDSYILKNIDKFNILKPRFMWVHPDSLQYYHRNYCQKHLLETHFNQQLLITDTETTYMERLGFLKVYTNGVAEFSPL